MKLKANMKVWVIAYDGTRRPARTCNGHVWKERGNSVPVWYITGNGHTGWDHAIWIQPEDLEPRTETFSRPYGRKP